MHSFRLISCNKKQEIQLHLVCTCIILFLAFLALWLYCSTKPTYNSNCLEQLNFLSVIFYICAGFSVFLSGINGCFSAKINPHIIGVRLPREPMGLLLNLPRSHSQRTAHSGWIRQSISHPEESNCSPFKCFTLIAAVVQFYLRAGWLYFDKQIRCIRAVFFPMWDQKEGNVSTLIKVELNVGLWGLFSPPLEMSMHNSPTAPSYVSPLQMWYWYNHMPAVSPLSDRSKQWPGSCFGKCRGKVQDV